MDPPRAWLTSALILALGCKATPGSFCLIERAAQCSSVGKEMATCTDHKWVFVACRGRNGCAKKGFKNVCDKTIAAVGDPCASGDACAVDGKTSLRCTGGRFVRLDHCEGPNHCSVVPAASGPMTIQCDVTYAREGDSCDADGAFSCTIDKTSELRCAGHHLQFLSVCRGPEGCHVVDDKIKCDRTIAEAGDACTRQGANACSVDGQSIVTCKDNQFVFASECDGKGGCYVEHEHVRCVHAARPGNPCSEDQDDQLFCDHDRRAVLLCKSGALQFVRACRSGCDVTETSAFCK